MRRLLLVDGYSLLFRAYFGTAYGQTLLRSKDGTPTNALYAFHRMLHATIRRYEPTHVLVAFDFGKKTRRHAEYAAYKGTRAETPNDLITQIPLTHEMLNLLQIATYKEEGFEADDIIASVAAQFAADQILILSTDRDLLQLVSKHVHLVIPGMGGREDLVVTLQNFHGLYGCSPDQIPDLKGLVGDSSDNLPGVKGIGPVGATKLLASYQTLENIYAHLDDLPVPLQAKLRAGAEISALCKRLATLDRAMALPIALDDLTLRAPKHEALGAFYDRFDLRSLQNGKPAVKSTSKFENLEF